MSQPSFPDLPNPLSRDDVISMILASIAHGRIRFKPHYQRGR